MHVGLILISFLFVISLFVHTYASIKNGFNYSNSVVLNQG